MCVIIHKPAGVGFDEEDIRLAYENNEDGFGYMYYHPEHKRIIAKKTTKLTPDQIVKVFEKLKDYEVCYHYRFKTVGDIVDAQCHPFKVLDKRKHGVDMYFMHNGTISNHKQRSKDESDTQAFNRTVLRPILAKVPSLVRTEAFQHLIQEYIGSNSKLVFMYGDGKVVKVNEEAGSERKGCWVSNTYSFTGGYRKNKTTTGKAGSGGGNRSYQGTGYHHTRQTASITVPPKTTTNSVKKDESGEKKSADFLGSKITIDEKVWVYSYADDTFHAAGKVVEFTTNCAVIAFEDAKKKEVKVHIWLDDGQSYAQGNEPPYYAIPAYEYDNEPIAVTVGQKKEETAANKTDNVVMLPEKKQQPPHSGQAEGNDSLFMPVTHGNKTVDAKLRWGGAWVADLEDCDYDGFTIPDFYDMDSQERFSWFSENTESAFNMLQDLAENIVLQDEEYMDALDYYEDYENVQDQGRMLN